MRTKHVRSSIIVLGLLFMTVISGSLEAKEDETMIELGSRRELFVDGFLVEEMQNVQFVLQTPRDEGPILEYDKPWEGPFCAYGTIVEDEGLFRFYYRGRQGQVLGHDGDNLEVTCYAESRDGINWTKPSLEIFEACGTKDNNVVLAYQAPCSHNFSPFLDTRPNVPEGERYKALAGLSKTGLFGFVSADGLHWSKIQVEPVMTKGMFDSQNVAFWSELEKMYVCYLRTWTGEGFSGFRTVSRTTSEDFIHWSDPVPMSFGDTPMEHLYTNNTQPCFRAPHIYVAIEARFMPGRQVVSDEEAKALDVDPKYYKDCSDAVLMTSRGGTDYDRTFMEGFVRPGTGLQNWVSRTNYPVLGIVQTSPEEMSIYINHDYAQPTSHVRRYSLRLDGFSSLRAPYEGGQVVTKPFTFDGSRLMLNFSTSAAGGIQVEIQDADGTVIPGYSLEDCREMIGNEIERAVSWQGGESLDKLAGQTIRLRFVMKDADLFALRFIE